MEKLIVYSYKLQYNGYGVGPLQTEVRGDSIKFANW